METSIINKHQVHNLIILDESGSMESIKDTIIDGFNEIVQTVQGIEREFSDQQHLISFVTFNGLGHRVLHFNEPVINLQLIDKTKYKPDASTPLYDAMGFSIIKLSQILEKQTDYSVLVTILTDGEENASKEFNGQKIKQLVEELKLNRWTFTYIGADHDVEKFASSLSIDNTMKFDKNDRNIEAMFLKEKQARTRYSEKIKLKEDASDAFYGKGETKKSNNGQLSKNEPHWLRRILGL